MNNPAQDLLRRELERVAQSPRMNRLADSGLS